MIDLVVTNYRTPADLVGFLGFVEAYPPSGPFTVTVVNVEPDQADVDVADRWCCGPGAGIGRHIRFDDNIKYARACNRGVAQGVGDMVAVFNADVRLTDGVVDQCVAALAEHPEWGVVGPRQVDQRGRLTAAGIFGTDTEPRHRAWLAADNDRYADVRDDAVMVAGSAMFFRRAVWDELTACPQFQAAAPGAVGAMLPTDMFYDDTYLCYHARAHGYRVVFYGPAKMVHHHHGAIHHHKLETRSKSWMLTSLDQFRAACDIHGLAHE